MSNIHTYDLFISYAYEDKDSAQLLSRKLRKLDFLAWFDVSKINKEDLFDEKIRQIIDDSAVCLLLIGAGGQSPWVDDSVWSAIHSRLERTHGTFRVIPVILPGTPTDSARMLTALIRTQLISYRQQWTVIQFKESLDEEDVMHQLVLKIRGVEANDQLDPLQTKFRESVRLRAQNALNINWSRLVFDLFSKSLNIFEDRDETNPNYEVNTAEDWRHAWRIKQECYDSASKFKSSRSSLALLKPDIHGERTPPIFIQGSYRKQQSLRRRFHSYSAANNNIVDLVVGQGKAKTNSLHGGFAERVEIFLKCLIGVAKLQRKADSNLNNAEVSQVTRPHKWETLKHVVIFKKSKSLLIEEMKQRQSIRSPQGTFMPDGGIDIIVVPTTWADIPKQLCEHCAFMQLSCLYDPQDVKGVSPDGEWMAWKELFHRSPECDLREYEIINSNKLNLGEGDSGVSQNTLLDPTACSASYFYGTRNTFHGEQMSTKKYIASNRCSETDDIQSARISDLSDLLCESRKLQLQFGIRSVINSLPQDMQIISHLWAERKSPKEIAREIGMSVPVIYRKLKTLQTTFIFSKEKDYPNPSVWRIDCPHCKTSAVDNAVMFDHFSPAHRGISYVDYKDGLQSCGLTEPDLSSGGFLLYIMELQNQELH